MIWSYLRRKVRESILAGVSDALDEIEGDSNGEIALAVDDLRTRIAPALPAPAAAPETNGRRKRQEAS